MRVLAIMCHPDDMELNCCGTLIKYKQAGHDVISCHAANGNMGHVEIMPDPLREIRAKEAQKAGALAGIEVISADINDLTMNAANEEQLKKILRIVRYAQPDVIITHAPEDYCSDHVELSKLVFNASFSATCPHFMPELGPVAPLSAIYFTDTSRSVNFTPSEFVDITDVIELKEQMLACHESQIKWLMDHDGLDVIGHQRIRAEHWGTQCKVKYAEAFRPLMVQGRMRAYRVLP